MFVISTRDSEIRIYPVTNLDDTFEFGNRALYSNIKIALLIYCLYFASLVNSHASLVFVQPEIENFSLTNSRFSTLNNCHATLVFV